MGLKDGTLASLVEHGHKFPIEDVFPQMLSALDFLATKGILHRDIKPQNILYLISGDCYQFQLADFGLCSDSITVATSRVGTPIYMAPEVRLKGVKQTCKVDIWSLFVTMLWTYNEGFRRQSRRWRDAEDARSTILAEARTMGIESTMAIEDPQNRASAAYILLHKFNGVGLTTPRWVIPRLNAIGLPTVTGTPSAGPSSRPVPYFT